MPSGGNLWAVPLGWIHSAMGLASHLVAWGMEAVEVVVQGGVVTGVPARGHLPAARAGRDLLGRDQLACLPDAVGVGAGAPCGRVSLPRTLF
jgi:hypothetical protein